ncbi:MAG: hypothetical protein FJZ56_04715 [Chlamydiae bacterium]|nr:hypothetical protein [Chlamydiota bacterium]
MIDFLDVPVYAFDEFFQSLALHKEKSMDFYKLNGGSKSKGKDLHYHSKKLKKNIIKYLDDLVETYHPVLYKKYLERYRLAEL